MLIRLAEAATRSGVFGGLSTSTGGMDEDLCSAVSSNSRASLVPAAAVIPARVAFTDVAAVEKLVVRGLRVVLPEMEHLSRRASSLRPLLEHYSSGPGFAGLVEKAFHVSLVPSLCGPSSGYLSGCQVWLEASDGSEIPNRRG